MKVTITGCKARDRAVEFGRLTVLTGPNEIGKSALTDAIRFAAVGYIPLLGRRPQDTAALMRGNEMRVRLQIDDLHGVERRLLRQADGGYQGKLAASWCPKGTPQSKIDGEVLRLFGASEADVVEMLDLRELFKVSPNQRAARIEQLLAAGAVDTNALLAQIAELWWRRLAGHEETELPNWRETCRGLVAESQREAIKTIGPVLQSTLTAAGLKGAAAWANEQKREANAEVNHKRAARDEIQTRVAGIRDVKVEELQQLERHRNDLQQQIGMATERARAASDRHAEIQQAEGRVRTATLEVERCDRRRGELRAQEPSKLHRDSLVSLQRRLDELTPPAENEQDAARIAQLEAEADDLMRQAEALTQGPWTTDNTSTLAMRLKAARDEHERAQQSPWTTIADAAMRMRRLLVGSTDRLKQLRAIVDEIEEITSRQAPRLDQLAATVGELEAALAEEQARVAKETEQREAINSKRDQLTIAAARRRDTIAELRATAAADSRGQRAAYEKERAELIEQRDVLKRRVDQWDAQMSAAEQDYAKAAAAHGAAVERRAGIGEAPASAAEDLARLQDDLRATLAEIEQATGAATRRAELDTIARELLRDEANAVVFAALEWAVTETRARFVTQAASGLKSIMQEFLSAAGRQETPFFYAAGGKCDIGWVVDPASGGEILLQAFNRASYVLFCAALTAAMAIVRAPLVRLVMVEAGECDRRTLGQLLAGMAALSNRLTSVIVETPHVEYLNPSLLPQWQVLQLTADDATIARPAA